MIFYVNSTKNKSFNQISYILFSIQTVYFLLQLFIWMVVVNNGFEVLVFSGVRELDDKLQLLILQKLADFVILIFMWNEFKINVS